MTTTDTNQTHTLSESMPWTCDENLFRLLTEKVKQTQMTPEETSADILCGIQTYLRKDTMQTVRVAFRLPIVTKGELTDNSPMPFGKFRGRRMADLPEHYLHWLVNEDWVETKYPKVHAYLCKSGWIGDNGPEGLPLDPISAHSAAFVAGNQ